MDDLLKRAKKMIHEYCQNEFENDADFTDLSNIGVAYTEMEDEPYPIQAIVDLIHYKIETKVFDVTTHLEQYDTLEELIQKGLPYLNFDDLVYINDEDEEKIKELYTDEELTL